MRKLVVLLVLGTPLFAYAQEDEFLDEFALLEDAAVVESAARHRQEIGMSPSAITVITREDIEASGANTIPDLLRIVPGMEVIFHTATTSVISARLHWTNENYHFLVLIDGREAGIELLGQTIFEIEPISVEDIQRIEVIRGPGSALYGANATAGVISITTRAISEETSGWAMVSAGELGSTRVGARGSTRLGDWGLSLGGGVDLLGTFEDPHAENEKLWKWRALAEHRWSETARLLVNATMTSGVGTRMTEMGLLDLNFTSGAVRVSHESENLRGRIYWRYLGFDMTLDASLDYGDIRLADLMPATIDAHTVDGEVQWTPPRFWQPLLLITGGGVRLSWLHSDEFIDGDTYTDTTSPDFHQPGITHMEVRAGAFVHGEVAPADWVTGTFGLRFDYNNISDTFLSPRLAVVFQPASGQFLRLGVARAFRMPSFRESNTHIMVEFPDESPITGPGQQDFLEFMSKIIGNPNVDNEELWAFEAGYLGRFLDGQLSVNLELYCNLHTDLIFLQTEITPDQTTGLPDLDESILTFTNSGGDIYVLGSELTVRFKPARSVMLLATWAHREVFDLNTNRPWDDCPKNLISLGGRFQTEAGLVGSLYLHSRSEFMDRWVENPAGLMAPMLVQHMDNMFLVFGRLGWKIKTKNNIQIETGLKLFLPVSPSQDPHFRVREKGGIITLQGKNLGGEELIRVVTAYLEGSF